jgi:hypothetical protein
MSFVAAVHDMPKRLNRQFGPGEDCGKIGGRRGRRLNTKMGKNSQYIQLVIKFTV